MVKSSAIRYHRPVRGIIRATCKAPDPAKLASFKSTFHKKGKARIRLEVTIEEEGQTCIEFEGIYVALR